MPTIAYDDFDRVEMRVATITAVEEFPRAGSRRGSPFRHTRLMPVRHTVQHC
jgi:hypothetical protein